MRRPSLRLAFAAFLYGAIVLAANAAAALTPAQRAELEQFRTGQMANLVIRDHPQPRVEASFRDRKGNPVTLAHYRGKVVLLNLWAGWCPPCRAEMPALDRLAGALQGPDFAVVAVSVDHGGVGMPEQFFRNARIRNLHFMHDGNGDLERQVGVVGLPETLILDRAGHEIARLVGEVDWDSPEARALIGRIVRMTRPVTETART